MFKRVEIRPPIAFDAAGLVLGPDTRLARIGTTNRPVCDPERFRALLTVALGQIPSARSLSAIERGLTAWQAGDTALANLPLVFSGLPRLDAPHDLQRLKAAEILFDAGLTVDHVVGVIGLDGVRDDLGKDVATEPRVPPGNGRRSGEWTSALWSSFSAWLDEDVPVYDQDTGTQVGTQSRARAIATSPFAVGLAGTAALLGGEAALPVAEETETLSPFAQRYLSTSGGRLGGTTTRQQLYEIARSYEKTQRYTDLKGDGYGPEEFIPPGSSPNGKGTYVDFTANEIGGGTVRIQTIDTLADGVTPTTRELGAAARIKAAFPNDKLILIPKRLP